MITVDFNFSALAAKLDKITAAADGAVRPSAQAGAQVFYDEVRQRTSGTAGSGESSAPGDSPNVQTGHLRDAIYQAFADKESGESKAVYRVSWNKRKAPHGHLLENGTSKMAARPFLRPAYDAARRRALQAANARMVAEVKKATT